MEAVSRLPLVMRFDTRAALAVALAHGLLAWRTGPAGLVLYALGLVWVCAGLTGFLRRNLAAFRTYALFTCFWMAAKLAMDWLRGVDPVTSLPDTGLLGARLAVTLGLGLALAQSTSTHRLGLAVSWWLRPVLGKRAWKAALGLALMVRFLPLAWESGRQLRLAMRLRGARLPWHRRALLLPTALLRVMAQKTWQQAMALSARGLDRAEAWEPDFDPAPSNWLGAALVIAAGYAASLL